MGKVEGLQVHVLDSDFMLNLLQSRGSIGGIAEGLQVN